MAQKLLINVAVEETRVALASSGIVTNLEIDTASLDQARGNIYKGVVHRVNPSLQAAFVDYGADKQGFLPVSEIHPDYYPERVRGMKVPIQDILHNGQELMIQVMKDEIGSKGAGLSTYISIPGRYLVLMAESGKTGISRRLPGEERQRLKDVVDGLDVPDGFGVIIRTAGVERPQADLESDLDYLRRLWKSLDDKFKSLKDPGLIHQERSIALRFIRDYATTDLDEIICDDPETVEEIQDFCRILMPEMRPRIRHYSDPTPLFSRYQIEDQIDDIFARRIDLPSGGYLVIDQTEALVACDVNSGRVKTDDIEKTALKTNLEAATEIARQLKIRDLGGLVIVDFIDMRDKDNIRAVEKRARDSFAEDKAKVKFTRISDFGLMEISRQRLKTSIMKGSFDTCSHCGGTGKLRSTESSALYLLRRLKETVIRGNYLHASAKMPVSIANYVLNRKRRDLLDLETESKTTIEVHGHPDCAPTAAYVELLTRPMKGKRPRRMVQTFDLVRSEVEKREVEEGDDLLVAAAGARGVSLSSDEYRDLYRKIEADMLQETQRGIVEQEARERAEIAVEEKLKIGNVDPRRGSITVIHEAPVTVERSGGIVGFFKNILFGAPVDNDNRKGRGRNNKRRENGRQQTKERSSNKSQSSSRGARTRPAPVTDSGTTEKKKQGATEETPNSKTSSSRRRRRGRGKGRRDGQVEGSSDAAAAPTKGADHDATSGSAPRSSSGERKAAASGDANRQSTATKPKTHGTRGRNRGERQNAEGQDREKSEESASPKELRDKTQGLAAKTSSRPAAKPSQTRVKDEVAKGSEGDSRQGAASSGTSESAVKLALPKVGGVIDLRGGPSAPTPEPSKAKSTVPPAEKASKPKTVSAASKGSAAKSKPSAAKKAVQKEEPAQKTEKTPSAATAKAVSRKTSSDTEVEPKKTSKPKVEKPASARKPASKVGAKAAKTTKTADAEAPAKSDAKASKSASKETKVASATAPSATSAE